MSPTGYALNAVTLDPLDEVGVSDWVESATALIFEATTKAELQSVKSALLGDRSALTRALRSVGSVDPSDRATAGRNLGGAHKKIQKLLEERRAEVEEQEQKNAIVTEGVDVTLPTQRTPIGARHPLSLLIEQVEDFFLAMGWEIAQGPEIEHEWFNFDSLNFDADHPARQMQDTLYIDDESVGGSAQSPAHLVLRTHTSPVQARELLDKGAPLYVACPGKVFRSDALDATHTPVFHQVEGLAVDRGLTMEDLKGTLDHFAKAMFGEEAKTRLRPSFFPFTEPSAEMDLWFPQKKGGAGWIEWGGCGMVNPNVLIACGIDPDEYTGFAFGMGLERTLMLQHGIADMHDIVEGDLRFSRQFGLYGRGR